LDPPLAFSMATKSLNYANFYCPQAVHLQGRLHMAILAFEPTKIFWQCSRRLKYFKTLLIDIFLLNTKISATRRISSFARFFLLQLIKTTFYEYFFFKKHFLNVIIFISQRFHDNTNVLVFGSWKLDNFYRRDKISVK
jgi:hypothetical protein